MVRQSIFSAYLGQPVQSRHRMLVPIKCPSAKPLLLGRRHAVGRFPPGGAERFLLSRVSRRREFSFGELLQRVIGSLRQKRKSALPIEFDIAQVAGDRQITRRILWII